jgi:hypothetical protein
MRTAALVVPVVLVACGGNTPPPKTEEATPSASRSEGGEGPVVEQELGSIDPRAVEQTFDRLLNGKLETCHKQGRDRLDVLSGEAKVFVRVGKDGRARYSFFEESTIGDQATEKCVLETLAAAEWPKPKGGEAEVRSSFSWSAGNEREPTPWATEKVTTALAEANDVKHALEQCKSGVSGTFRVTAYVEPGEPEPAEEAKETSAKDKNAAKKKGGKKPEPAHHAKAAEHGGRFKAVGVTAPGKETADKVDCIADALKHLPLPSPGSYLAKVTFTL